MSDRTLGCLDDARALWKRKVCLSPVSKNMRGELRLLERERQDCEELQCRTLKTDHLLRVDVQAHEPCDSKVGGLLDGELYVRRLVTALADGTGLGRGLHTGEFRWVGAGATVEGNLSGMTNVGTHREPVFDPCQPCHAPGYMEGRLCGRIVKAKDQRLLGCSVTAAYRIRFDPSEGFQSTGVEGTLEGLVVCPCDKGSCLHFTGFTEGSYPNPWPIGGHVFDVRDHTGATLPSADVTSWGGHTGLNAGWDTKISLGAPADDVDITLVHFAAPATVTAYDATTTAVASATMTLSATPETLHLSGTGITTLVVKAPSNETLILEICAT